MQLRILFDELDEFTEAQAHALVSELERSDRYEAEVATIAPLGAYEALELVNQLTLTGIPLSVLGLILSKLRERLSRAVIIEQDEEGNVVTRPDFRLPRGTVVVATRDGPIELLRPSDSDLVDALRALRQ